jgi:hypothetical protein
MFGDIVILPQMGKVLAVLIFGSLHQGKEQKSQQPLTQISSSEKTD